MSEINGKGRIDLMSSGTALFLQDQIKLDDKTNYYNTIKYSLEPSLLSKAFLSYENRIIIQNGIKAGVYKLSNGQYTIGPQDCDSLKIIMRSVFLQHSANQEHNISKQISDLNKIVCNYCIQQVYSEAQGYMKYINDVSTLVVPIAHPVMSSNNDKQLELKKWF